MENRNAENVISLKESHKQQKFAKRGAPLLVHHSAD